MAAILVQLLNGIWYGIVLFLIASGLTVILGILDVLNLTHGQLFAYGAFFGISTMSALLAYVAEPTGWSGTAILFLLLLIAAIIAAGLLLVPIGAIVESVFVKPVYDRHEVYQLLLTFGLLLVMRDSLKFIYESTTLSINKPYTGVNALKTSEILGFNYPTYNYFTIIFGVLVFAAIVYFFNRTKRGRIIRATAINREMATAMGVNTSQLFMLVFAFGAFLAGIAGAIIVPTRATTLTMGDNPLVLSFVVIVIGGLGSLRGAFVAAIVVGVVSRLMIVVYAPLELAAPFLIMIGVLLIKPEGLFGTWGEIE